MTAPAAPTRRSVLKGAAIAAAAAGTSALRPFDLALAAAPARRGVFGYGVASGDPTAEAVVIWTRATPPARRGEPVATPGAGWASPSACGGRWPATGSSAGSSTVASC